MIYASCMSVNHLNMVTCYWTLCLETGCPAWCFSSLQAKLGVVPYKKVLIASILNHHLYGHINGRESVVK